MDTMNPPKGHHDVYCYLCGKKCGHVTHYGGNDNRLQWCDYCNEIPNYCYECFRHRKEDMATADTLANVREFTSNLKDYQPGEVVTVVDASRKKIIAKVQFMNVPENVEFIKTERYTR